MSLQRYPRYKGTGIEWLGEVPDHWRVQALKYLIQKIESGTSVNARDEPANADELGVLKTSCVYSGIFDASENKTVLPEEYDRVSCPLKVGTVIVSRMNTPDLVGAAGLVRDAQRNIYLPDRLWQVSFFGASPAYVYYWSQSDLYRALIRSVCAGTSSSMQNLGQDQYRAFILATPPLREQLDIADFLDCETGKIDALVEEQRRLIELLKEKRQAVISHAVAKGLNPHAPMKDSGIEWLGKVPAHWTIKRLRFLFRQEKRQDQSGKAVLSVYRDYGVVLKDSRDDNMNKTPEDLSTYQLVNPNDLVVNKMKAWQGSLGVSDLEGITSPDYIVFTPRHREYSGFLHLLLRSQRMVSIYRSISNGIRPAQWRLEPDSFLSLRIFVPPAQEQRELVSFVARETSRFNNLIAEATRAINLLQERRVTLISAAVTGKIDVRGLVKVSVA